MKSHNGVARGSNHSVQVRQLSIQFPTISSPVAQPGDGASAGQSTVSLPDGKKRHLMAAYRRQRPNVGERSGSHRVAMGADFAGPVKKRFRAGSPRWIKCITAIFRLVPLVRPTRNGWRARGSRPPRKPFCCDVSGQILVEPGVYYSGGYLVGRYPALARLHHTVFPRIKMDPAGVRNYDLLLRRACLSTRRTWRVG